MFSDLFSAFDPGMSSVYGVSEGLFWVCSFFLCWFNLALLYVGSSRVQLAWGVVASVGVSMFKVGSGGGEGTKGLLVGLFLLILGLNLGGLIPWVFSYSGQLVFSLSLSLLLWLVSVMGGWTGAIYKSVGSVIGSGLPLGLAPVIGVLEVISLFIRPVTLGVRLMANMVAGHVILGLLTGAFCGVVGSMFFVLGFGVVGFHLFEWLVCSVQAYVFSLLLVVYFSEWQEEELSGWGVVGN